MSAETDRVNLSSLDRFGQELMRGIESRHRPNRVRQGIAALAAVAVAAPLAVAGANELTKDDPAPDAPSIVRDPATIASCVELLGRGGKNEVCVKILQEFAPDQLPPSVPAEPGS